MRRPLATFGLCFFLAMLAAVRLPVWLCFAAAGVLAAGVLLAARLLRPGARGGLCLALSAGAAALALCGLHSLLAVRPVAALAGQHTVQARVTETAPGYGEETVRATLRVLAMDSEGPTGFTVQVDGLPEVEPGQVLSLPLAFRPYSDSARARAGYGKGLYIAASLAEGGITDMGISHTPLTLARRLQYAAADNIRAALPGRLSGLMAAMAVGDRRAVSQQVKHDFQRAGLSHLLVVSGLHLAVLCGLARFLLLRALPGRRRLAAQLCMAFVLAFMLLAGLSASIVRSGVMCLLVLAAPLFWRRTDVLSSLGLAIVILLAANPWACADVGLLLSFTATLGMLGSGEVQAAIDRRWPPAEEPADDEPAAKPAAGGAAKGRGKRYAQGRYAYAALRAFGRAALPAVCATLATLPVLVYAGLGLSLLSVPANVLAVPLLPFITVCGLLMAVPASLPVLGWLAAPASVLGGGLLVLLEKLAALCAAAEWAWLPLGGAFGLVAVLAVYALLGLFLLSRRPAALIGAAALVPLALALHLWLNTGTVRLASTGGANPSLVVMQGRQAVVLYRGQNTLNRVEDILAGAGIRDCPLLVDLRLEPGGAEYEHRLGPAQVVVLSDTLGRQVLRPLAGAEFYLARQGNANLACVQVAGLRVGVASGAADYAAYGPLDVLLAGTGAVRGEYETLITGGGPPDWADAGAQILYDDGGALLWVRPGKAILIREVRDGVFG